ncbi:cytochrome d ubiquinol oxidase subunit II [bacterium]|nr:cytochrome d ubiquinol oxidase subunit II [bacterium]
METVWFAIVAAMLAIYIVLDGFDFGVGILHRFVARTNQERRVVLAAIGPVWDGNEVWLIAAGGVLFMAFPKVYATAFSGFYLALMIVLWLLILRGVAIEFRGHFDNPLWREFWDTVFSVASGLLAIVFGAALGNLVRGVPLDETGLPGMALFTNFWPGQYPGLFDWYTLLVGLFACIALAGHGAIYLDWRTTGPVQERSHQAARRIWLGMVPLWVLVTVATVAVQPEIFTHLLSRWWSMLFILLTCGSFAAVFYFHNQNRPLAAFLSSSLYLLGLSATTLIGHFPHWLRSTINPEFSLTASNSISAQYGVQVALAWWAFGMLLTCGYFVYLFYSMRDKVDSDNLHGH